MVGWPSLVARVRRVAVWLVLAMLVVSACSQSAHAAAVPANGCAPAFNERLDPRSTVHLFPAAAEPRYLTDPPTSGPHRLGPPYQGVVTSPIPRSSQVAMLEAGFVLIQAQTLPVGQRPILDGLASDRVTVAPPAGPLPSPVVATAWTWKLQCGSLSPPAVSALRAFIAAHRGVGFTGNAPATTPNP